MRARSTTAFAILAVVAITKAAPPADLKDPFLDNFAGEWKVERKFPSGKTVETSVRGEWVLKHHFIQLHYGDATAEYEAYVFVGFDDAAKAYVCHWVDVFGGNYSLLGHGKLDPALTNIEFYFEGSDGSITNKFTFDSPTKTWTSLIRQQAKAGEEWKIFCDEKWSRK